MRLQFWWQLMEEPYESYLPDFILAFAFFTSIFYAVLGNRFERQRPAIVGSAAIGTALSVGLVWWEQANDFSIRNLGPIAVGFAVLLLAFIMYQCIHHIGGSWAGAGITIGVSIIIAGLLGFNMPVYTEIIHTITVVSLIIGLMALFTHSHSMYPQYRKSEPVLTDIKRIMADLYRQRHLSTGLDHSMKKLRKEARLLDEHPQEANNIILQIKRMLPAQGYLTEQMAQLRAKAHQIRNGHIARLDETREAFAKLPASFKKKASAELIAAYNKIVGIDTRLERLDRAVAENEKRICELTQKAQEYTNSYNHQKLFETIKAAEKLQHHNSRLIKIIERTENKLSAIAKKIVSEVKQIEKPG